MSEATKKKRGRQRSAPSHLPTWLRATLIALPLTLLLGLALLLGAAALLLMTKDPDRYRTLVSLPILYITAFLGGLLATRIAERRAAFLCGATEGLLLFLVLWLIALCLPSAWAATGSGYIKFLLRLPLIPASLLGALLGSHKKEKRRKRY